MIEWKEEVHVTGATATIIARTHETARKETIPAPFPVGGETGYGRIYPRPPEIVAGLRRSTHAMTHVRNFIAKCLSFLLPRAPGHHPPPINVDDTTLMFTKQYTLARRIIEIRGCMRLMHCSRRPPRARQRGCTVLLYSVSFVGQI